MRSIIILYAALACGCSSVYTSVMLPNGAPGGVLTCSHKTECFQEANIICRGRAYAILQQNDQPASDFISSLGKSEFVIQCESDVPHVQ